MFINIIYMKFHQILLVSMLVLGGLSILPSQGVTAPIIEDIHFNYANNSTVGPGSNIMLQVNITHSGTIDVSAQIILEYWDPISNYTNTRYLDYLYLDYNSSTGYYEGGFTVGPYWPEGTIYVQNIDVSTTSDYYYFSMYDNDYTSPFLLVSGTDPDLTGPELVSLTTSHPYGATLGPGDNISFTINVVDNQSGFSNGYMDIYYDDGNYSSWVAYLDFSSFQGEQNYTGTASLTIGEFFTPGTYFLDNLYIYDMEGNWRSYSANELNFSFMVNGTTLDDTPPVLNGIDILSSTVTQGDFFDVWVNVSDDVSGLQYGWINVYALSANGSTTYAGGGAFYDNGTLDATLTVQIYVDNYVNLTGYDYLYIDSIYLEDMAFNSFTYYNGTDFTSPMVPLVVNRPPALVNVSVDSTVHRSGELAVFGFEILADQPSTIGTQSDLWVSVSLEEDRPDGQTFVTYVDAFTNGTPNMYYASYFIDYSAPTNTTIYVSDIVIYDGFYTLLYVNGINMTSPIVTVSNDEPSREYIEVIISPDYVSTEVNTPVDFSIMVTSYFTHDMPNVTLVVEAFKDGQAFMVFQGNYYLMARSSFNVTIQQTFNETGSYRIVGTLYDDIGAPWTYSVQVDVTDSGTGGTPSEPTEPTSPGDNSTSPVENSTETNSTLASPTFELTGLAGLPGFEFSIGLFTFAIIAYGIRKKRKF